MGAEVVVDVTVSNLGSERIGAYDIRVSWNSGVLTLTNVAFGEGLDGPVNSLQAFDNGVTGSLILAEASLDVLAAQTDSLRLATLTFEAIGTGESPFQLQGNIVPDEGFVGDFSGQPILVEVVTNSVVINSAPVANPQSVTTDEDVPAMITLSGTDANDDPLTFALDLLPANGALSGTAPDLTYTPNADFNGSDTLTFTVDDGTVTSEPAEVAITISPVNDPPVADPDTATTLEDVPVSVAVLDNDSDIEGGPLSVASVSVGVLGVATTDGLSVLYVPLPNLHGIDVLSYVLSDNELQTTGTLTVTILPVNDPPVANDDQYSVAEDNTLFLSPGVLGNDQDVDGDPLSAMVLISTASGALTLNPDGSFVYAPNANFFGKDDFTYLLADGQGATAIGTVVLTVTPVNDAPTISVDVDTQTVQYSDGIAVVTLTGTDIDSTLTGNALSATGVPDALTTSAGQCSQTAPGPAGMGSQCTWTLSGDIGVSVGSYTPTFTVSDGALTADAATTILVEHEDADARINDDNILAVGVNAPGSDSSLAFALNAVVTELQPDQASDDLAAPGDIDLAQVSMQLVPVGPGGTVAAQACTTSVSGTGYAAEMQVSCDFDDAPVNTYTVELSVSGDFYNGSDDDVLTVFDPSLGFTTGGGWFYWPGTAVGAYPGDRTNFGYTMKYSKNGKNVRGSLLLIRRQPDGSKFRLKSNSLQGLALGEDASVPFGWASFSGKATYLEPGWPEPLGNHNFTAYVEDRDTPGAGIDRFWIEVRDRQDQRIPQSSMDEPATDNATPLQGGNIVAPHSGGGQ